MSDRKLKASRKGLKKKDLRDLEDLTMHDVQFISDDSNCHVHDVVSELLRSRACLVANLFHKKSS